MIWESGFGRVCWARGLAISALGGRVARGANACLRRDWQGGVGVRWGLGGMRASSANGEATGGSKGKCSQGSGVGSAAASLPDQTWKRLGPRTSYALAAFCAAQHMCPSDSASGEEEQQGHAGVGAQASTTAAITNKTTTAPPPSLCPHLAWRPPRWEAVCFAARAAGSPRTGSRRAPASSPACLVGGLQNIPRRAQRSQHRGAGARCGLQAKRFSWGPAPGSRGALLAYVPARPSSSATDEAPSS